MSNTIKNKRVTIYFREHKDCELISMIESANVFKGDLGGYLKELMLDGLIYRSGKKNVTTPPSMPSQTILDTQAPPDFSDLKLSSVPKRKINTESLFDKL